jgi:hypothetical protein
MAEDSVVTIAEEGYEERAYVKHYLMTIPLQQERDLRAVIYKPYDNPILGYDKKTRFPLIPLIASTVERGDKIRVSLVQYSNGLSVLQQECVESNREKFEEELENLGVERSFTYEVETISANYEESATNLRSRYFDVSDSFERGEEAYVCVTFGTKQNDIVITLALANALELRNTGDSLLREDFLLGNVVYGQYDHNNTTGTLYDCSWLFEYNALVKIGAANLLQIMRHLGKQDDAEEVEDGA